MTNDHNEFEGRNLDIPFSRLCWSSAWDVYFITPLGSYCQCMHFRQWDVGSAAYTYLCCGEETRLRNDNSFVLCLIIALRSIRPQLGLVCVSSLLGGVHKS